MADDGAVDDLVGRCGEDLVSKSMADMFKEANEVTFLLCKVYMETGFVIS
jgi:hypothetical protein